MQLLAANTLRNLSIALLHKRKCFHQHIHGHCGHPWNELADVLCDLVGNQLAPPSIDISHVLSTFVFPIRPGSEHMAWMPVAGLKTEKWVEYPDGMIGTG